MKACLLPEEHICTDVDNKGALCAHGIRFAHRVMFYDSITLHLLIKSDVSACFKMKECFLEI